MRNPYGYEIGSFPGKLDGTGVLSRLVDGLAFRFYWATEGLRPEDFAFRPGPDSMSMIELHQHVLNLAFTIKQTVLDAPERERCGTEDPAAIREEVLDALRLVRERLDALDDEQLATHQIVKQGGARYPVWNIVNGPISDALTHVGQINAWRRLSGNPTGAVDVFSGIAPST